MQFEQSLQDQMRNTRFRNILREVRDDRTSVRKAFEVAIERTTGEINTTRLLAALERILRRRVVDLEKFIEKLESRDVKSFSRTIKELQDRSAVRSSNILGRLRNGTDSFTAFKDRLASEGRRNAGTGTLIGSTGSSMGDTFRENMDSRLSETQCRVESLLKRAKENPDDKGLPAATERLKDDIFTSAVNSEADPTEQDRYKQETRPENPSQIAGDRDGSKEVARLDDLLINLAGNHLELIELYGHLPVDRRFEINDKSICPECIKFARMGWQLRGVLPPIGQESRCKSRCRCRMRKTRLRQLNRSDALAFLATLKGRKGLARDASLLDTDVLEVKHLPQPERTRFKKLNEKERAERDRELGIHRGGTTPKRIRKPRRTKREEEECRAGERRETKRRTSRREKKRRLFGISSSIVQRRPRRNFGKFGIDSVFYRKTSQADKVRREQGKQRRKEARFQYERDVQARFLRREKNENKDLYRARRKLRRLRSLLRE